jgi:long-chain acyl-CoA synthetase
MSARRPSPGAPVHRIWLHSYPSGIEPDLDYGGCNSLVAVLKSSCDRYSHRPAFSNMGRVLTYGDVDRLSARFAAYLLNDLKLKKGDRVAIMLPNVLQYPIALFGVLRAGLVVVNTNPMYTARELKHQLDDSGAAAIVVLDNFAHTLAEVVGATKVRQVVTTGLGDLLGFPKSAVVNFVAKYVKKLVPDYRIANPIRFNDALARGAARPAPAVEPGFEDLAFLQYTGGTTGVPKGAMLSHGNLLAEIFSLGQWFGHKLRRGEERFLLAMPVYHVSALAVGLLFGFEWGACGVMVTNPRDLEGLVAILRTERPNVYGAVSTLYNALLNHAGFREFDHRTIHLAVSGGAALLRRTAQEWNALTGKPMNEGYGLSETAGAVTYNRPDGDNPVGSIGLPLPGVDIRIVDDEGDDVDPGEPGEITVRAPHACRGYWQREDDTAAAFFDGVWFRTGDVGRMDHDGYVYVLDRKKDLVIVSGFNVYPNEVEDVISTLDGVLEVAVVGVPDDRSGEAVKAVIVRKDPDLTIDAIKAHCRANLTGYKQPRHFEFRESLPKSNVGKILRRELRGS